MPKTLHYDGGGTVEILTHTAQDVTLRSTLPDGTPDVATIRNGLFLLTNSRNGTTFSYEWQSVLPDVASLRPRQALHFEADMVVEHAHRTYLALNLTVLRADHLTVDGCDYPVIVVERTDAGTTAARQVLWISRALRMPLRDETTQDGVTKVVSVIAME